MTRVGLQKSAGFSAISVLIIGVLLGVIGWGGFNWAMELTNTETFCISCHEMEENVYQEYQETIHYSNRTGVRATCPDCHVPKEWIHKVKRKIQASNELYHKAIGSIDTPEKFEAKRLELAMNVWRTMKATDSRECRNCHDFESMDFMAQQSRSADYHDTAIDSGQTCIDCHKGIAHHLPEGWQAAAESAGLAGNP
ncbi:MAG: NapC/NirT family cytochrome c [Gammaproteobacteria bacterium]|nr:NapC/NirT family cytochrome c [Gammaproteobacteria bacterium]